MRSLDDPMNKLPVFPLSADSFTTSGSFNPVQPVASSSHCLRCRRFPSTYPSVISFWGGWRATRPKYRSFWDLISPRSNLDWRTSSRTLSFETYSTHEILNARLWHHISNAPIFSTVCIFNVHDSIPYVTTGHTSVWISRAFKRLLISRASSPPPPSKNSRVHYIAENPSDALQRDVDGGRLDEPRKDWTPLTSQTKGVGGCLSSSDVIIMTCWWRRHLADGPCPPPPPCRRYRRH